MGIISPTYKEGSEFSSLLCLLKHIFYYEEVYISVSCNANSLNLDLYNKFCQYNMNCIFYAKKFFIEMLIILIKNVCNFFNCKIVCGLPHMWPVKSCVGKFLRHQNCLQLHTNINIYTIITFFVRIYAYSLPTISI